MDLVECELCRLVKADTQDMQVIVLREKEHGRTFPICIGHYEVSVIERHLRGEATRRPMTHELLSGVIEAMGGTLVGVAITDIRDETFFGLLQIDTGDGVLVEVDCRPSDGIALATLVGCPILVSEHVIEAAGR